MIDTIWWNRSRGNWDSGLIAEIFDKHPDVFIQHNTEMVPAFERAIVIVVGKPSTGPLRSYLETLKSGLVILTSDEDAYIDWRNAIPKHLDVMTQYYNQEFKSEIKERILLGPPTRIKDYKINKHLPKKYLWSFIGQVSNPFRQQCVDVLKTLPDGFLQICDMFGGYGNGGMEYQEYLDIMCQSSFVVCPSGSMSCDSFRLYEAMECGATPITDVRSPRDLPSFNYWESCYPDNTIPKVSSGWDKRIMDFMLEWRPCGFNMWWPDYKYQLEQKLLNIANA